MMQQRCMNQHEFLERQAASIREDYLLGNRIDAQRRSPKLQMCAWQRVWDALILMTVTPEDELPLVLLSSAEEDANTVLASERFDTIFQVIKILRSDGMIDTEIDSSFIPSAKQKAIEIASGRMYCHKIIHYSRWLLSGVRDRGDWQKCLDNTLEYYRLAGQRPFSKDIFFTLLMDASEASEFLKVISLYQNDFLKAVSDDELSARILKNPLHMLYFHALYKTQRPDLKDKVQSGLSRWRSYSQCWDVQPGIPWMPDWERLSWIYINLMLNDIEPSLGKICAELRGY